VAIVNECHVAELNIVGPLVSDDTEELILISSESGCSDTVAAELRCIIPVDDCPVAIDRVGDVVSEDWRRITSVALKVRC
jgi:hypothetical protein